MTNQPAGGEKLAEIIRVQAEIAGAGLGLAQVMDVVTTRARGLMGEAADSEMYRQKRLRQDG